MQTILWLFHWFSLAFWPDISVWRFRLKHKLFPRQVQWQTLGCDVLKNRTISILKPLRQLKLPWLAGRKCRRVCQIKCQCIWAFKYLSQTHLSSFPLHLQFHWNNFLCLSAIISLSHALSLPISAIISLSHMLSLYLSIISPMSLIVIIALLLFSSHTWGVQKTSSVTRLGNLLDFGQLLKVLCNNQFAQISYILRQFL